MGFVFAFVASWMAVFVFYGMKKRLSPAENAFVYLTAMTLGVNAIWIIAEELKWVELTKDALPYAGYLLYRTFAVPLMYVIAFNLAFRPRPNARTFLWLGALCAVGVAGNEALRWLGVYRYQAWNFGYDAIRAAALVAVCYGLLLLYRKLDRNGGVSAS